MIVTSGELQMLSVDVICECDGCRCLGLAEFRVVLTSAVASTFHHCHIRTVALYPWPRSTAEKHIGQVAYWTNMGVFTLQQNGYTTHHLEVTTNK